MPDAAADGAMQTDFAWAIQQRHLASAFLTHSDRVAHRELSEHVWPLSSKLFHVGSMASYQGMSERRTALSPDEPNLERTCSETKCERRMALTARRLVTGQSPASSGPAAKALRAMLNQREELAVTALAS